MKPQITPEVARSLKAIIKALRNAQPEHSKALDQAITRALHGKANSSDMGKIARAISVNQQLSEVL